MSITNLKWIYTESTHRINFWGNLEKKCTPCFLSEKNKTCMWFKTTRCPTLDIKIAKYKADKNYKWLCPFENKCIWRIVVLKTWCI